MIPKNEKLKKWLIKNIPYEEMSNDELDAKIVENFGSDKLEELNILSNLDPLILKLCDYLGIEYIPVIFEDLGLEDSRYYLKDDYISINNKYLHDELEQKKCIIHEIRHAYQRYCAYNNDSKMICANDLLVCMWIDDLMKDYKNIPDDEKICLSIEIDAFAFTKYILNKWFNIEYHHYDKEYDKVLDLFINKFYI